MFGNWFVRIALTLAVIAVIAFDGIEIAVAHVGGKDDANNAAFAAAQAWHQAVISHESAAEAETQVVAAAKAAIPVTDRLVGCAATDSGGLTWHCTVVRTARTLVAGHLGFLRPYTVARETGTGSYQP